LVAQKPLASANTDAIHPQDSIAFFLEKSLALLIWEIWK
jgi:hypothetical protein